MEKRTHQFFYTCTLSQMYFEFLLLHHVAPFENLGEAKIHQDSWQVGVISEVKSKIHGEHEGCQIYGVDQPLIGNSLAPKTLHQSHPRHGVPHFDEVVANHMQDLSM